MAKPNIDWRAVVNENADKVREAMITVYKEACQINPNYTDYQVAILSEDGDIDVVFYQNVYEIRSDVFNGHSIHIATYQTFDVTDIDGMEEADEEAREEYINDSVDAALEYLQDKLNMQLDNIDRQRQIEAEEEAL